MKREGLLDWFNGSDLKSDLLGEVTNFRAVVCQLVDHFVAEGKWFGFATRVNPIQQDIFAVENDSGVTIGNLIKEVVEEDFGEGHRTSLYRYLLHDYLCYYEEPSVMKSADYSGFKDSYKKSLVTSNIKVVAEWLGISEAEANATFGSKLYGVEKASSDDDLYPYLKLTVDRKTGTRKVSKPRTFLDLGKKGVRVIPVFALRRGVAKLYEMASRDFYNVTFVKDSGQERTINICFDYDKLKEVYKDLGALTTAFEEQYKGSFMENSTIDRGYIRVIEVGSCLKSYALRSINFARILKIEKAEPDLTFIDVDLTIVKDEFLSGLACNHINLKEFVDMLDVFNVGQKREYNGHRLGTYADIESWVTQRELLLSTPFIKQLALFIMGNPQWYGSSGGDRGENNTGSTANDVADGEIDFGDIDFETI